MPKLRMTILGTSALRSILLCMSFGFSMSADAADDKKIAKAQQERIQRMQQAQQALEAEKSQLTAANAELERKLRSTQADFERSKAQARKDAAKQELLDVAQKEKEELSGQIIGLNAELTIARQKLQSIEQVVLQLRQSAQSSQRDAELQKANQQACDKQNNGLYQINIDLLSRYEGAVNQCRGVAGKLFNPTSQVRLENEGATYRDQLDVLKRDTASNK
jgi:DNA repair exonuclease SbcCD ATPase subunit